MQEIVYEWKSILSEVVSDENFISMLDGRAYRWYDRGSLAPTATQDYLIYIPAGVDLWFYGRSFAGRATNLTLTIYTNPTITDNGVEMPGKIFNRNSDYPASNLARIWKSPAVSSMGTESDYDETSGSVDSSSGVKGSTGSQTSQEFPRVMPKDTYIFVRVKNLSTQNTGSFIYKLFWSEIPR